MPKFLVQTGCKLPENVQPSLVPKTNAIRFGIKTTQNDNVHFLQFVTRQHAWIDTFENFSNTQPEFLVQPGFTSNDAQPEWKVDVIDQATTPYYNHGGAYSIEKNWYFIYDEPDLCFDTERVVFCTFLIKDNEIFRKILWSRQNVVMPDGENLRQVYSIISVACDHLPTWALSTLQNFLANKQLPEDNYKAILQPDLIQRDEGTNDFLKPPRNWVTTAVYPTLFLPDYPFEPTIYRDNGQVLDPKIHSNAHRLFMLAPPPVEIHQAPPAQNEDNTVTVIEEPNDKNAPAGLGQSQ
jgi:hypothetical protein